MSPAELFPRDYVHARESFRSAARAAGARQFAVPTAGRGPGGEELSIDVARLGDEAAPAAVVVSSGLHGVEGYLGSAVQRGLLEPGPAPPSGVAMVLVHALNPHGYAHRRRFDADNVDLNRNFLIDGEPYSGSTPGYETLDRLLNPRRPPGPIDELNYLVRGAWLRLWRPPHELRQAVAGGQYDFPRGLFFGGRGPSPLVGLLREHLPIWVGPAARVLHLDFHTGLGRWATEHLLIDDPAGSPEAARLATYFGADRVEPWHPTGIAYQARGNLGPWCRVLFAGRTYDLVTAEYGTYDGPRMIGALRAENQSHHWGDPSSPAAESARRRLVEAFAPADRGWRDRTAALGLALVGQSLAALKD